MKKSLLYLFMFCVSLSFAQNWQNLGSAQFTDDAKEIATSYSPTTGEEFLAYTNTTDSEKLYVLKYNGTSWEAVGGAVSTTGASLISIEINPVTNQPWVSYMRTSSLAAYVKYFDGSTWQTEASNLTSAPVQEKTQIRFDPSGNAFVALGLPSNAISIYSNRSGSWAQEDLTPTSAGETVDSNFGFDFPNYEQLIYGVYDPVFLYHCRLFENRFNGTGGTHWTRHYYGTSISGGTVVNLVPGRYTVVAASKVEKYWVGVYDSPYISRQGSSTGLPAIPDAVNNTHYLVDIEYNTADGQLYFMYVNSSNLLKVQRYTPITNVWTELTNINVDFTSTTNIDAELIINPVNGKVYLSYIDGTKASMLYVDSHVGPTIFVNKNATGSNNGTSWNDAFTDIQDALVLSENSAANKEIWVAQGAYTPGTNREDTFQLYSNTKLYGGFNGTETLRSQRNPKAYKTILSGDLSNNDNANLSQSEATRSENAYHVLRMSGDIKDVVVDGITVSGGNANGYSNPSVPTVGDRRDDQKGAAIQINNHTGSSTDGITASFINCVFEKNTATKVAVFNSLFTAYITNKSYDVDFIGCVVRNNYSGDSSAFEFFGSSGNSNYANGSIVNCLFYNNTSANGAAALLLGTSTYNGGSSQATKVDIVNSTFTNNNGTTGQTMSFTRAGQCNMYNSIVYGNGSAFPFAITDAAPGSANNLVEGGGLGSIDLDPLFVDAANTNYRLQSTSPAVDAGDNTYVPAGITTDLYNENRFFNTTVDMGAYEFGATPPPNYTLTATNVANGTVSADPVGPSYIEYTNVTVTASADAGYQFKEWTGDVSGTTNPLTITMDSDKTITPVFEIKQYALTINIINNGTVTANPSPTNGTYDVGTTITLTANPGPGAQLVEWTGDAAGTTITTTVIMDADKTVTANFSLGASYVDSNATGNNDGTSWANAYTNLQTAINNTTSDNPIWVAAGTYKPGVSRNDSFIIGTQDLKIYGGFNGTETEFTERNIMANPTVLSGDLNDNDAGVGFSMASRTDNTKNIVKINANGVLVDGLHVVNGDNSDLTTDNRGSAILINESVTSLTLKNCQIKNNVSRNGGVVNGFLINDADINIENCIFDNNVSRYGSALLLLNLSISGNVNVNVDMINSLFSNNKSMDYNSSDIGYTGSAAWIRVANYPGSSSTVTITNCTFANNEDFGTGAGDKGPLALGRENASSTQSISVNNSVFYGNTGAGGATSTSINKGHLTPPLNNTVVNNAIGEDGFSNLSNLTNTSNANPLFTDAANNDFTLSSGSPAIDTGDNAFVPVGITIDLLGNQRIYNTTVDMGAYEYSSTLGTDNFEMSTSEIKLYPNPTSNVLNIKMSQTMLKAEVFNLQGQKVIESNLPEINASNLSNGMYLIKIKDVNGLETTKRFIKN